MGTIRKIYNRVTAPRVDYQPLIEVRVFKDVILDNLKEYQKQYPKLQFAPVLKSNAYGHGLVQVAQILDKQNLPFFMVDSFFEALVLKREGIKTKILILGYAREAHITKTALKNISFGIISLEQLRLIASKLKTPKTFQLKVDTGMHRQGLLVSEINEAIELVKQNKNIILEGLCTHFADADGQEKDFTEKQIEQWNKVATFFRQNFPKIKYFHASNSAGSYYAKGLDANVGRLGLGLYGINTSPHEKLNLKPALELVSVISSVKNVSAGEKVGYGITFEAKGLVRAATVPVGYNEGVDSRLSNKGSFKVNGAFCPIIGRVSMNMSSIDVSKAGTVHMEDEVVVISANEKDENSVENLAKICGCIPYEILVHIPSNLRKVVI